MAFLPQNSWVITVKFPFTYLLKELPRHHGRWQDYSRWGLWCLPGIRIFPVGFFLFRYPSVVCRNLIFLPVRRSTFPGTDSMVWPSYSLRKDIAPRITLVSERMTEPCCRTRASCVPSPCRYIGFQTYEWNNFSRLLQKDDLKCFNWFVVVMLLFRIAFKFLNRYSSFCLRFPVCLDGLALVLGVVPKTSVMRMRFGTKV